MEFYNNNKQLWNRLIIGVSCALGAYLFFQYAFTFIFPFFIGWILSLLFHPLVSFLEKRGGLPRGIGTIFAILLLILFFVVVVAGVWHKLYKEAALFYENLPGHMENLRISMQQFAQKWDKFVDLLPMKGLSIKFNEILSGVLPSLFQGSGSASFNVLKAIPNGFILLIISMISSYFFTKDKRQIDAFVNRHAPMLFGQGIVRARHELKLSVLGYLKTQVILMLFTFAICIAGLAILSSPYAFLLSVIISIIDAIPFFGSGFILWPGALIFFFSGDGKMAVGYLVIYLCVNLMRQVMQPKILGVQIGLHPLLTLIAMYVGLKCLGLFGMILGPVVAVLIKAIFDVGEKERKL